ncbi:MAG: hypothetical protein WBF17_02045, partial [Phycisphaerae bacterium]
MSASPALEELFASATVVDVAAAGGVSQSGTVADAGDTVMYKFTTEARGTLYLDMQALAGDIDPFLQLYNEGLRRIKWNNDKAREDQDSRIALKVYDGQTLYVLASGHLDTTGDFELQITSDPVDDYANAAAEASMVRLRWDGSGRAKGTIHYGGDDDYVGFVAAKTGLARVQMYFPGRGNSLAGALSAYNDSGELVGYRADVVNGSIYLQFGVVEGQTYCLRASGLEGTTGRYGLLMSSTLAQEFVDAEPVSVPGESRQTVTGTLASGGQATYKFTATASGYVYLDMRTTYGSTIDSYLEVFNTGQRRIARNDNLARDTEDSRIRLRVKAGQTYYVRASAVGETEGPYELTFDSRPYDDYGNAAEAAWAMRLRRDGSTWARGRIHYADDTDYLAYTALNSGLVRVQMSSYGRGNDLSGALSVYDAAGDLVTSAHAGVGDSPDLSFSAVQGQTYYLMASSDDGSTGRYVVKVLPMILQEFIDAEEVDVPVYGEQVVADSLAAGGTKMYKFTPTAGGYVYLDMAAADGSAIDSYLEVYNSGQRRIARNDNANRQTQDSRVRLRVKAGETYYVRASAAGGTEGDYELTFTTRPKDDAGNDIDHAVYLRLRSDGSRSVRPRINYSGDIDVLEIVAPVTGQMDVTAAAHGRGSGIAPMLRADESTGDQLAIDEDGDATCAVSFDVVEGETYYLTIASLDQSTGRYSLNVLTTPQVDPD